MFAFTLDITGVLPVISDTVKKPVDQHRFEGEL
jgi:hypothetical protein